MQMNKVAVFFLVVIAAATAEDQLSESWADKIKDLQDKFVEFVNKKASDAINSVEAAEEAMSASVKQFFDNAEQSIETAVQKAIEDLEVLKNEDIISCYNDATQTLVAAEVAAAENLSACKNMSQAYEETLSLIEASAGIIQFISADVAVIVEGVAVCETKTDFDQFKCIYEYTAKILQQLNNQWPDAKVLVATAEALAQDIPVQVNACLATDEQQELDAAIQDAISAYSVCSQQQITTLH